MNRIYLLGTFPPPVHGMAVINQSLFDRMNTAGMNVKKLNTSPKTLKRDFFSLLNRLSSLCSAWLNLLKDSSEKPQLYTAISGNWGQVYDIISLLIARVKHIHCIIHHHSISYLQRGGYLTRFLIWIAGKQAVHIVLCDEMASLLNSNYGIEKPIILSNLAFFPPKYLQNNAEELSVIGFLSNISREKGGEIFIELAYTIKASGLPIHVMTAGPCQDNELRGRLQKAVVDGVLEWRGAVYDEDKKKFFNDIDVLVLPSKNEAEPLVIWEVLSHGIPVISEEIGCMPSQIGDAGVVVSLSDDFILRSVDILVNWYRYPNEFRNQLGRVNLHFNSKYQEAALQWGNLVQILQEEV